MSTVTWETFYPPKFVEYVKTVLAEVELSKRECRRPSVDPYWIQRAERAVSQTNFDLVDPHPNHDIKTSPLIDFSSFQFQKKDFSSFAVYGHIKLTTDYGQEYFLFERDIGDPMVVRFDYYGMKTTFRLPESELSNLHWLPKFFWLELYLVDKNRTVIIANEEEFLLDFCNKVVDYDTKQKIIYDAGRYGVFTVTYTIYRFAAVGALAFDIFKPENEFSKNGIDVCVSGAITAAEGQRRLSYKSLEYNSAKLSTNHINLFPVVVVPVYSHLNVSFELVVDGQIIRPHDVVLVFKPCCTRAPLRKDIVMGEWCVSLTLYWTHAFGLFHDDVFVGEMISYDRYLKMSGLLTSGSEDNALTNPIVKWEQWRNSPVRFGRFLGEVFSVSISSFDQHRELSLNIFGTIKLKGCPIFEKNEKNIEVIKQHQLLKLLNPECCYEGLKTGFRMIFDLKDAHDDEFCKGCVVWDAANSFKLHDRRMCSVIIGKLGYAYVHYAIFDCAIQAKLIVRFLSSSSSCYSSFKVYGKIYARYSKYRYSTHYERKYYRIMLFKKRKVDSLNIICGGEFNQTSNCFLSEIPLSKDVVAVPCDDDDGASLILEVELHVVGGGGESDCTIKGELIFDPRKSDMVCTKKIEGQNPLQEEVEVEVKWS